MALLRRQTLRGQVNDEQDCFVWLFIPSDHVYVMYSSSFAHRIMNPKNAPRKKHIFNDDANIISLDALFNTLQKPKFNRTLIEGSTTAESLFRMALYGLKPTFGVCVPDGCTSEDVFNNYQELYRSVDAVGVPLSCETKNSQESIQKLDSTSYVTM
jgi:hypothetical protein